MQAQHTAGIVTSLTNCQSLTLAAAAVAAAHRLLLLFLLPLLSPLLPLVVSEA
jgi:hypothetical protein